ncbi:MAG TPA: ABC transporter ATP-binding protein [Actinocrinis sp.]|nr:ABC transporter ATP-binding protein [Actinocrinis sp.]
MADPRSAAPAAAPAPTAAPAPASWLRALRGTVRATADATALAWRAGRHLVLGQAAVALLGAVLPVAVAWLTKDALDALAAPGRHGGLLPVGMALVGAGLFAGLLPHAERYARQESQRRTGLLAQDRLFAATERLTGLSRFEDPVFIDRLRLANQAGGVGPGAVVTGAVGIGRGVLMSAGFLVSLAAVSAWLAAAVVSSAVPALLAELALARRRAATMWRIAPSVRRELFFQHLLTSVQAAKELRLFAAGRHMRERMAAERSAANRAQRRMDRREVAGQTGLAVITAATAGAAMLWALAAAGSGRLTVGDVSLLISSVAGVQGALSALVTEVSAAQQQLLVFSHYRAVVAGGPDLPVRTAPQPTPPLRRGIELRGVWFRYSESHPWALRDVDLALPAGSSVALIGRNGAGKSTLVKLLCRLYDPQRGAVLWDGVDLRDLDPAELRGRIGAVFQDFMCYDLTALDNIALGDVGRAADRDRIHAAARRAAIHDTLAALPRGYDTPLSRLFPADDDPADQDDKHSKDDKRGEHGRHSGSGMPLSGGQWQRLALARAYLRGERDVLILDEPSSGLDPEAEHEIHVRLREFRAGRTSVLVSHRLGAVRDADLLVVLDEGRIVERGTHTELLDVRGRYARMFETQARAYAAGGESSAPVRQEVG